MTHKRRTKLFPITTLFSRLRQEGGGGAVEQEWDFEVHPPGKRAKSQITSKPGRGHWLAQVWARQKSPPPSTLRPRALLINPGPGPGPRCLTGRAAVHFRHFSISPQPSFFLRAPRIAERVRRSGDDRERTRSHCSTADGGEYSLRETFKHSPSHPPTYFLHRQTPLLLYTRAILKECFTRQIVQLERPRAHTLANRIVHL